MRSTLFAVAIAIGSTVAVAVLNFSLHEYLGTERPLLFLAAVMLSAWLGGLKAGLVATLSATLINQWAFLRPQFSLGVADPPTAAQSVLFLLEGMLISAMAGRLHDQTRRAQAAVRARDEFLAVASHELKNPVTTLRLALGSVRTSSADAPEAQRLAVARRQVERLGRLLDDLLQIGRLGAGALQLHREPTDLGDLTRAVVAQMQAEAERAGSSIALHVGGPVMGAWDRVRLEQVVMNLISNAIKYGRGRPIEIDVRAAGRFGRLVVADRGTGIPAHEKTRVFERFGRGSSAVAQKIEGVGVGLWVVREIVEKHGGRIDLHTEPGVGTTFTVNLPLAA